MTLADFEAFLLAEIKNPAVLALVGQALVQIESDIEAKTTNPFVVAAEKAAFALVNDLIGAQVASLSAGA